MRNIAFPILNALSGIFLYLIGQPCTNIHLLPLNDGRLFFFRFFLKEFKWAFKTVHFVPNTETTASPLGCWTVVFGGRQKLSSVNALVNAAHYKVALMTKLKAYNLNKSRRFGIDTEHGNA